MAEKQVVLIILDGWGVDTSKAKNTILSTHAHLYTSLLQDYPHTELQASGTVVGLPDGQSGNSEVGHLNLGAGRIVYQDSTRISNAIRKGEFFENAALLSAMDSVKRTRRSLHLMGLLSDGGVHSRLDHIFALFDMAKKQGITKIFFHAFLDGRDTPPSSAIRYIEQLEDYCAKIGIGKIATVSGRYYAMDRDKRWERVQKAYDAMVLGEGIRKHTAVDAVRQSYENHRTDEFMIPAVLIDRKTNMPRALIQNGDAVIFCNFRADRAREITRSLTEQSFQEFKRSRVPTLAAFVCLTTYDETFDLPVAFAPVRLPNVLGAALSAHGLKQLRIAETEKYAHVTFFFNGGEEPPFALEDRVLIPSPRDVATYDKKPEMSAREITKELIKHIRSKQYGFILVNYANPDMVGHTGMIEAGVKAVEVVDECLGNVLRAASEAGALAIVTSDHGNIEKLTDTSSARQPHTAHTGSSVPFIIVQKKIALRNGGILADVAPTVLSLLGIEKPTEMTGNTLILPPS